jgi:hypothetical protein
LITVGTDVCRRSTSCGRTQTDSRITEKSHSHWAKLQYFSKMSMTNGEMASEPPKAMAPIFQDISFSLVLGKTHCMIAMRYSDEVM